MFSLFHNIWIKPNNEETRIMYIVLNDNTLKMDYWILELEKLMERYDILSINQFKKIDPQKN